MPVPELPLEQTGAAYRSFADPVTTSFRDDLLPSDR
jgi:hypothetical protein